MLLQAFLARRDFNRPGLEILRDLVQLYCSYRVELLHTQFGVPRKLDQRSDLITDANTFVPMHVQAAWDDRFAGANGFLYYRLPIDLLNGDGGLTVDLHGRLLPLSVHQVLAVINEAAGAQLTVEDVEDLAITDLSAPVRLVAKPTSLVWNNDPVPVFPIFHLEKLQHAILRGFVWPQP